MKKIAIAASVLFLSSTAAYAAAPGPVGKAAAACCSALAACCDAIMACCA